MIYSFCEINPIENNRVSLTRLSATTTKKELDEYRKIFNRIGCFDRFDFFVNMIEYDGVLLLNHLQSTRIKAFTDDKKSFEIANKLIFDISAAFGSFIEYIEKRVVEKQSCEIKSEYKSIKENWFNNEVYLFWYYLRNYTIHYGIPFNRVETNLENGEYIINLISEKSHLLKYKEWKHAKPFIKSMPEIINIQNLVEQLIAFVKVLYGDLLYLLRNVIVETNLYVEKFLKNHLGRNCNKINIGIIAYKNEVEYISNSNGTFLPLNLARMAELLNKLSLHNSSQ